MYGQRRRRRGNGGTNMAFAFLQRRRYGTSAATSCRRCTGTPTSMRVISTFRSLAMSSRSQARSDPGHSGTQRSVAPAARLAFGMSTTELRSSHPSRTRSSRQTAIVDSHRAFDVVLLDYRLPDSRDLTLLCAVRRLSPRTRVLMMSAYAGSRTAPRPADALRAPADRRATDRGATR